MKVPISNPIEFPTLAAPHRESPAGQPGAFADLLADAVGRVGELQKTSDEELRKLLAGEPVELHRVLLAGEKAGLAFNFGLAVRNKVVEAYQEVMRIQV